jgi:hypothetical protein
LPAGYGKSFSTTVRRYRVTMPIEIDEFDERSPEELGDGPTQPELVVRFLAANAEQAFRPVEIARETGVGRNSINAVLARLEERGLVRHKGNYWAITDDIETLQSRTEYEVVTRSLNDTHGSEDPTEWVTEMPDHSRE